MRTPPLDKALEKVHEARQMIECDGLKPHHRSRILEARKLARLPLPAAANPRDREYKYQRFLKHAEKECGDVLAALCIIAIGKTAIIEMKSGRRSQLALKLNQQARSLECPALREFINNLNTNEGWEVRPCGEEGLT